MNNFSIFGLQADLIQTLESRGITAPTPIQEQAIPVILNGRDILATAQTGTGKTLAFVIPLVIKMMESQDGTALILTPTRELAGQVRDSVRQLFEKLPPFRTTLLIGGDSMFRQLDQLRKRPRLIIGTPGRIMDHMRRGTLRLDKTRFLVLDEADRMLDMGFGEQLEEIIEGIPTERQTLMFSATLPTNIVKMANKYLKEPERIAVGATSKPAAKIKQQMVQVSISEKFPRLLEELDKRDGSIIVFVKTKMGAANLAERLQEQNHEAQAIHGDLRQRERDKVMNAFRQGKSRIMVATDIAARGLDVPQVKHVINYELPQCTEDYVHRIGRTARAGADGEALCLVAPYDRNAWDQINKAFNIQIPSKSDKPAQSSKKPNKFQDKRSRGAKFDRDTRCPGRDSRPFRSERPQFGNRPGEDERLRKDTRPSRSERANQDSGSYRSKRPRREGKFNLEQRPMRAERSERQNHDARPNHEEKKPLWERGRKFKAKFGAKKLAR